MQKHIIHCRVIQQVMPNIMTNIMTNILLDWVIRIHSTFMPAGTSTPKHECSFTLSAQSRVLRMFFSTMAEELLVHLRKK